MILNYSKKRITKFVHIEITAVVTNIWHAYFPYLFTLLMSLIPTKEYYFLKMSFLYNLNDYHLPEILFHLNLNKHQ